MALTKTKARTAAKTLREAVDERGIPNSARRAFATAADALETYAGDAGDEALEE